MYEKKLFSLPKENYNDNIKFEFKKKNFGHIDFFSCYILYLSIQKPKILKQTKKQFSKENQKKEKIAFNIFLNA